MPRAARSTPTATEANKRQRLDDDNLADNTISSGVLSTSPPTSVEPPTPPATPNTDDLCDIQVDCFGPNHNQIPNKGAAFQVIAVEHGINGTLILTGWDTMRQLNNIKFANDPPQSIEQLLWSVVKVTKKKGFSPNITLQTLEQCKTPSQMSFTKYVPRANLPQQPKASTMENIKDLIPNTGKAIDIELQIQMNSGSASDDKPYRFMLTDKKQSINMVIWPNLLGKWPLYTFEAGQVLSIKNARVVIRDTYQYAATSPLQVVLNEASNLTTKDQHFDHEIPDTYYTKLIDIESKTRVNPDARFLVAIEIVQNLNRQVKGKEHRQVFIRDDTVDDSRCLTLHGPTAVVFTKDKFEQQTIVMTGLQVQGPTNALESIPSKFMWFYNHDSPTTELKEWVAEQLTGPP